MVQGSLFGSETIFLDPSRDGDKGLLTSGKQLEVGRAWSARGCSN